VVTLALEAIEARDVRPIGGRQRAGGADQKLRADALAAGQLDLPALRSLVVARTRDAGVQRDVAAQVKAIGDVVQIRQHGRLVRLRLRPVPLVDEFLREGVAVIGTARKIHPRAGVAVPGPGAADAARVVEHVHAKAEPAQQMQRVQATEAGANDDGVELPGGWFRHGSPPRRLQHRTVLRRLSVVADRLSPRRGA
jgi:hypothetical protein